MARGIRWSGRASDDLLEILEFWRTKTQSPNYSKKLYRLIQDSVQLIALRPNIGRPTNYPGVRIKIIRDYLIYYRLKDEFIEIILLWDGRRNPEILKRLLRD